MRADSETQPEPLDRRRSGATLALCAIVPALLCEIALITLMRNWLSILLLFHVVFLGWITWKVNSSSR